MQIVNLDVWTILGDEILKPITRSISKKIEWDFRKRIKGVIQTPVIMMADDLQSVQHQLITDVIRKDNL